MSERNGWIMNDTVAQYFASGYLCFTQTDKLFLMALVDHVTGLRVWDIARATDSKFRPIAWQVSKITWLLLMSGKCGARLFANVSTRGGSLRAPLRKFRLCFPS